MERTCVPGVRRATVEPRAAAVPGAVQRYLGDRYVQHNPQAADGPEAFIGFVRWYRGEFPELRLELKRMIAEGDLVVTHSALKTAPEDRGP